MPLIFIKLASFFKKIMNSFLHRAILFLAIVMVNYNTIFGHINIDGSFKKDTVSALVINPENPMFENLSTLTGDEIIAIIDSLLNQQIVSKSLLKEINDYAENRLLEHDYYNSLTNYYDNSEIPSNGTYETWDTENIAPYENAMSENDSSIQLTLIDKNNWCDFVMPLENPIITSNFGYRQGKNHNGMDLDLEVWDPIVASFDGMVRIAIKHPGYGRVVVIRHYNGLETLYAHLHRFKVKVGDIIEAGQIIGLGGSSGHSTGSHLHFEIRYKGKPLNPKNIINFKDNKLISESIFVKKTKHSFTAIPVGVNYYTIERGDFMQKIATNYGMTVRELCDLNDMKKSSVLRVGKTLRIK